MRLDERTIGLSPEKGARVVALGLLSEASEAARRLAAGAGDEALHDFRVALRRLRSTLRALRPWLEERVPPRHERRLRRLARSTNAARDAEVQLAWLATSRAALGPETRRAGLDLLVERLEARRRAGPGPARLARRYRRAAERLRRRLRKLDRIAAPGARPESSLGDVLAALVGERLEALRERMDAIRDAADQEAVHRARIEGKRLRYLLEPLRGLRDAGAGEAVDRLKRLQDVLGELHDAHVLSAELREALVDAAAERARQLHAAIFSAEADAVARERLRGSPRAGLLALARLVRERRDTLHAQLEREWRAGGLDALSGEVRAVAASLAARAGGERAASRGGAAAPGGGWLPGARDRRLHQR